MIAFVQAAFQSNGSTISGADLEDILCSLGLDQQGRPTNAGSKTSFVKGIRFLCNFHFGNYSEHEQADIMGELLFNSTIFSRSASHKMFEKSTRSMTSCIFNAVSLLKAIDSKAGALNDSAADEYSKIEKDAQISSPPMGKTMLRPRHNITRARKIANGLVAHLFSVETHETNPLVESHEDMVLFNPERLFRFMLDVFQLKEKAERGHLRFCITGDGADLCSSTNTASQCLFGLKLIDQDAINPISGEPLLCSFVANSDGEMRRTYHGAQSLETCIVAGAVMAKEKQVMKSEWFKSIISFAKKTESEGVAANGDAEAIPAQKDGLVGCGDLSFQQKMSSLGGPCKAMRFFCTYCETNSGDHDLLGYVTGANVCSMCIRNGRDKCDHKNVNDVPELESKGYRLIDLLLDDF